MQQSLQQALQEAAKNAAKMGDAEDLRNKLTQQRTKALETEKAAKAEIAELKEERQQLIKKRIEDSKRIEELEGDKVIILL